MAKLAFNTNSNVMSPKTVEDKVTLKRKDTILLHSLEGSAYIKDSKGIRDNLRVHITSFVDTKTNVTTLVRYNITAFSPDSPDYYNKVFKDYNEAANEYDRLATKFNGHKTI